MSRSRHAAQGMDAPAPRIERHIFTRPGGGLRTGWLLAISLAVWLALALAARYGLSAAFVALFDAWGIDPENAGRAPAWAQLIYSWHGSAVTLAFSAALLVASRWLRRLWKNTAGDAGSRIGDFAACALAGALGALMVMALSLAPDSSRPQWPLGAPALSWPLIPLGAVSLARVLAEEAFTKRVLYDGLSARWGRAWAWLPVCAVLLSGSGGAANAVSVVNALLLSALSCAVYERRGLWASTGLRWGWSVANALLLGFGGGAHAVYRFYGVSEMLLTGGDAGPMAGLWTTALLAGAIGYLFQRKRR